jgi:hypothetical protein
MTDAIGRGPEGVMEEKLPRRDWIVLPLISLLTICSIAVSLEVIARRTFYGSNTSIANCLIRDPSTGLRGIPNSVCWDKKPEGQPMEYRLNSCGHRAGMECGPKAPDTYRIVMTGSSFAEGEAVQMERTFAALLPTELLRRTGHRVQLYNEGMSRRTPRNVALGFDEILTAQPDVILWILTPLDFEDVEHGRSLLVDPRIQHQAMFRIKEAITKKSLPNAIPDVLSAIQERFVNTYSATLLLHYLYQSQSEYVKSFLMGGLQAGFLRAEPDSEWQYYLRSFEGYAADIEHRAKVAGVPLVVVLIPNRAQAAMISMGEWPAGYDPYRLGEEVLSIIADHGGTYVDVLKDFRTIPNPEQYYFPVDGHLNAPGNEMIAGFLAKELMSGVVPALSITAHVEVDSGK